eukprot:m.75413 g.75413  ORF g.75413 m.75413 type:complete len:111 (+) comp14405_c0_seq5:81-413(+)
MYRLLSKQHSRATQTWSCVEQLILAAQRRTESTINYDKLNKSWSDHTRSLYTFYKEPLLVVEAHGCTITDHQGREYLDFYNNVHQVSSNLRPQITARAAIIVLFLDWPWR